MTAPLETASPALPLPALPEPAVVASRRAVRAAVFLIVIECLLLAFPSSSWVVPTILMVIALSRLWTIRSGWVSQLPAGWNAIFLAVLFAAKYSLHPAGFPSDATFINTELAHELGCWLVSAQLLLLHDRRSLERVPVAVAGLGCMVVLCAGDVRLHSVSRTAMLVLMMLFIGGLGWASHTGREWLKLDQRRRLRRTVLLLTLLLAAIPTVAAARFWHQHERDLEMMLVRMMRAIDGQSTEPRIRFRPPMIDVSEGRITLSEKPTLFVTNAGSEPIYLRGRAFDDYRSSSWSALFEPTLVPAMKAPLPAGMTPQKNLFPLGPDPAKTDRVITVQTLVWDDSAQYIPLEAEYLEAPLNELGIDRLRNLTLNDESRPEAWRAYLPETRRPAAPPIGDELKQPRVEPQIAELSAQLLAGCLTTQSKIDAIEKHFHENYQYHLGIDIPAGNDPVTYFLTHRKPAHCEFFATGAAVLLRLGGVPTRYVTGYVPSENHGDGRWMARRKDAHAWVEAYDAEQSSWTIVEATPSNGVPEKRQASWLERQREIWRVRYAAWQDSVAHIGLWRSLLTLLQSFWVRGLLVAALGLAWWGVTRRYRATQSRRSTGELTSSSQHALNEWRRRIETQLARQGLVRAPHETLWQFRDRLLIASEDAPVRPEVEWLTRYSAVRYDDSLESQSQYRSLEVTASQIVEGASKVSG